MTNIKNEVLYGNGGAPSHDYRGGHTFNFPSTGSAARRRIEDAGRKYIERKTAEKKREALLLAPPAPEPEPMAPVFEEKETDAGPVFFEVYGPPSKPTADLIFKQVGKKYGYTRIQFESDSRHRNLVRARQELYARLCDELGLSLSATGRLVGDRDHTTVLYGKQKHYERVQDGQDDITLNADYIFRQYQKKFQLRRGKTAARYNTTLSGVFDAMCYHSQKAGNSNLEVATAAGVGYGQIWDAQKRHKERLAAGEPDIPIPGFEGRS